MGYLHFVNARLLLAIVCLLPVRLRAQDAEARLDSAASQFLTTLRASGVDTFGLHRVDCVRHVSLGPCRVIRQYFIFWQEQGSGKLRKIDACFQYATVPYQQEWLWRYCTRYRVALRQETPRYFRSPGHKRDPETVVDLIGKPHDCCTKLLFVQQRDTIDRSLCEWRFTKRTVSKRHPRRNANYGPNKRLRIRRLQLRLEKEFASLEESGQLKPLAQQPK